MCEAKRPQRLYSSQLFHLNRPERGLKQDQVQQAPLLPVSIDRFMAASTRGGATPLVPHVPRRSTAADTRERRLAPLLIVQAPHRRADARAPAASRPGLSGPAPHDRALPPFARPTLAAHAPAPTRTLGHLHASPPMFRGPGAWPRSGAAAIGYPPPPPPHAGYRYESGKDPPRECFRISLPDGGGPFSHLVSRSAI